MPGQRAGHVRRGRQSPLVEHVSVFRLRLGVALIALWWIPVWLLAPVVAAVGSWPVGTVTLVIAIVQTIIGVFGALIAGRQAVALVRNTPFRAVPKKIWRVLWTGKVPAKEPAKAAGASEPSSTPSGEAG